MAITLKGGGGTTSIPSTVVPSTNTPPIQSEGVALTGGWYVFFGVGAGILLSNTKGAPIVLALLSSALLYQISQLIEGK